MQSDVSDGLAALASRGVIDPKRACNCRRQLCGYAALAGVTLQHGLYRCAVAGRGRRGSAQMLRYEDARSGYDAAKRRVCDTGRNSWARTRPRTIVWNPYLRPKLSRQADAPILLIHGKDDTVWCGSRKAVRCKRPSKRAGKRSRWCVMPGYRSLVVAAGRHG